jgi:alpha-1,2-mannosyltransferase
MAIAFKRVTALVFLGVLPVIVLALAAHYEAVRGHFGYDFRGEFYPEAKLVLHGVNPFPAADADLDGRNNRVFPIPAALLLAPLTLLSARVAADVFFVVLIVALAGALRLLGVTDYRVYGIVALSPSTIFALQTENLSILLALLVAVAWRFRDRRFPLGVAVGVAVALKLLLWPIGIWLLACRRFASAAVAGGIAVTGTLLVLPFVTLGSYAHLMSNLGNTFGPQSYSVVGLLSRWGVTNTGVAHLVAAGIGLVVIAVASSRRSLPLAICASILLSPIVWIHYFVLLIIPLALIGTRLAAHWFLPLFLWFCPPDGPGVHAWNIVVALMVLCAVTALSEFRRLEPGLKHAGLRQRPSI